MKRRVLAAAALALTLGACATNDTAYRRADGYYAAAENGYGDYYYDRPLTVFYDEFGYGSPCLGFGYGWATPAWQYGFDWRHGYDPWFGGTCGYNAWYGFGYPWGWYRPWTRHHHHGPPAAWMSNNRTIQAPSAATTMHLQQRLNRVAGENAGFGSERDSMRRPMPDSSSMRESDGSRFERREPVEHRSNRRDASQR
jgi:hypothetical protein